MSNKPNIRSLITHIGVKDPHLHTALLKLESSVTTALDQTTPVETTVTAVESGPITTIVIDSQVDDGTDDTTSGHAALPVEMNGFSGCTMYLFVGAATVPSWSGDAPYKSGDPNFKFSFKRSQPIAGAENWTIYFVQYNPNFKSKLQLTGPLTSPNISITVPMATGGGGGGGGTPPTTTGMTVATPGVAFSDARLGGNLWVPTGIDVTAPTGGWAAAGVNTITCTLVRVTPIGFESTIFADDPNIPAGSNHYTPGPLDPNSGYDRPPFGSSETWKLRVTVFAADGTPAAPVYSGNFTVTGGGTATPAPNALSVVATLITLPDGNWIFRVAWTFDPTTVQFVNYAHMWLNAYVPPGNTVLDGLGDVGRIDYFNLTPVDPNWNAGTSTYTFDIWGPDGTARPDVDQYFAAYMVVSSGVGVDTASPPLSNKVLVPAVVTTPGSGGGSTNMSITSLVVLRRAAGHPGTHSVDGTEQETYNIQFNSPLSTDAKSAYLRIVNIADFAAAAVNVTGFTAALNPVVTFASAHGLSDGQCVYFSGLGGVSGNMPCAATISVLSPTTISLPLIDSTHWGAYTSGGTGRLLTDTERDIGPPYIYADWGINPGDQVVLIAGPWDLGNPETWQFMVYTMNIADEQLPNPVIDQVTPTPGNGLIDLGRTAKVASVLPTLPDSRYPLNKIILKTSDRTLWQNQSGIWVNVTASAAFTGQIVDFDIATLSVAKLLAGTLNVAVSLGVSGSLTVSGGGGTVTVNIDPVNSILVTNTANQSKSQLGTGALVVSGLGGFAGYSGTYAATQCVMRWPAGGAISLAPSSQSISITLSGGTAGINLLTDASKSSVFLNGSNSVFQVQGSISGGNSPQVLLDVNGKVNFHGANTGSFTVTSYNVAIPVIVDGVSKFIYGN